MPRRIRTEIELAEPIGKPAPLASPDCCKIDITGCIEQKCFVMTAIEAKTDFNANLSVNANPGLQLQGDARANAVARGSTDASAAATPGNPVSSADSILEPAADSDTKFTANANPVADSRQVQTMLKDQALIAVAANYSVRYHVCNSRGCVRVRGFVRDKATAKVVFNFQSAETSDNIGFSTAGIYPTASQFPGGVFTLELEVVDSCNDRATFADESPRPI